MRPLLIAVCLACTLACAALATVLAQSGERPAPRPYTTWNAYLGGAHSAQFTALDQITAANVSRLQVAWTFPAGKRTFLFNPLALSAESRDVSERRRRATKGARSHVIFACNAALLHPLRPPMLGAL